jgi:hypothetical protein
MMAAMAVVSEIDFMGFGMNLAAPLGGGEGRAKKEAPLPKEAKEGSQKGVAADTWTLLSFWWRQSSFLVFCLALKIVLCS